MINYSIKPVEDMSVEELIGQVIMIGLPDKKLDPFYADFIRDYKIGNYILFSRNYSNTAQMKAFMKELYEYTESVTGSYPLVSIDQEGGMVVRLFADVTFPASPLATSASSVADAPYKTGCIIARDMLALGISIDLAPCLEINEGLANPMVNVRGYGATKEIVLKGAAGFVKGIQNGGALSCIKHFPGAGSSTRDSHLELPIIEEDRDTLLGFNMYPFGCLTESDALMTSHCLFKSFDTLPSTLSPVLLTEVLREQMGYTGLIISDGMEMKAIADHYGIGRGSVMALAAGCDVLLLCHEYSEQKDAFDTVKKAVEDGELSVELLRDKVRRINAAKEKVAVALKESFTEEDYKVKEEEHAVMQAIVDGSYTLVKGNAPKLTEDTLIIAANVRVASIAEDEFDDRNLSGAIKKSFPKNKVLTFTKEEDFVNEALSAAEKADAIIVYSYDAYRDEVQKNTVNALLKTDKTVYVVSVKGPADRFHFEGMENYACLYEYTPNSIRTIVKQLKGEIELTGKLPL